MIILNTALAHHSSILLNSKIQKSENHYAVEEASSAGLVTFDTSNALLAFRRTCERCTDGWSWPLCKPRSGFGVKPQCARREITAMIGNHITRAQRRKEV